MKVQKKVSASTIIEAEGDNLTELFEAVAQMETIFGPRKCGLCQGVEIVHAVQKDKDGNSYYKLVCRGCEAEFRFGQRRDGGGLFPQLKDQAGNWKPDEGWAKWKRDEVQRGDSYEQPRSGTNVPY